MSDPTPEPIRKSSLPCTPPTAWEFHTWFPHPDGGGDMVPGERQRGVVVRRRISYGDWEPVRPERWADEPAGAASAVVAVAAPPTGQTTDRDRIAEVLYAHDHPGHLVPLDETGMGPAYRESAAAVLAVLPAGSEDTTTTRADVLAEAIRRVEDPEERAKTTTGLGLGWEAARDVLRRLADEAQQQPETETPAPQLPNHTVNEEG